MGKLFFACCILTPLVFGQFGLDISWFSFPFTARKRSLRRLCFQRCLSVHSRGVYPSIQWGRHPRDQRQTTPPGRHTPPVRHPSGRHPLLSACWDTHTPLPSACWDTPAQCMLGYSQQAGGTHPAGMHSCF